MIVCDKLQWIDYYPTEIENSQVCVKKKQIGIILPLGAMLRLRQQTVLGEG